MHQHRKDAIFIRSAAPLARALGLALAILTASSASAQQPQIIPATPLDGGGLPMDPYLWHVRGLPPGQRLAMHSGSGPTFRVIHALEEGTPIERLSCKESRGGYWCRIATVTRPRISGWVDGRYLLENPGFAPPHDEQSSSTDPVIVIDPF
ncbi:SH3 domain-containing protein [Peteryoungia ipomoeae]|uniref:SH3 domain-containing protein n=1 Tax=Peteryoungia ipomoeae TaxID=1210932 RepID=UPI001FE3F66E|nr:SH3 domain-containing protein [Peteryoungia ipomoeae]